MTVSTVTWRTGRRYYGGPGRGSQAARGAAEMCRSVACTRSMRMVARSRSGTWSRHSSQKRRPPSVSCSRSPVSGVRWHFEHRAQPLSRLPTLLRRRRPAIGHGDSSPRVPAPPSQALILARDPAPSAVGASGAHTGPRPPDVLVGPDAPCHLCAARCGSETLRDGLCPYPAGRFDGATANARGARGMSALEVAT